MARRNEREREQIKLRATYINNLASGTFTAGVLTPIITLTMQPVTGNNELPLAFFLTLLCIVLSVVLHYRASEQLTELDQ